MAQKADFATIQRIMEPDSIAIVGASSEKNKRGYIALNNLIEAGFAGDIYPVNPNHEGEILDQKVYENVSDIPGRIDLAWIATPAHTIADILEECGDKDAAGAVIIASGFSERGNEDLEEELVSVAQEQNVRLIGPNVLGISNVHEDVDLSTGADFRPGGLALISQSGNMGISFSMEANRNENVGLSHFISIGNESDLKFHEFLDYFDRTPSTQAILLYAEGMSDGRSFIQEAKKFVENKPILVLRGGVTEEGKSSAKSHTASIAGNADVIDQVYEQTGVIRVEERQQCLPVAESVLNSPSMSGTNIGIMTEGGGHATLATDAVIEHGLNVPNLTKKSKETLQELYPSSPNVTNPVDTMYTPETAALQSECAEAMLLDRNIDGLLICGFFGGYGDLFDDKKIAEDQLNSVEQIAELADRYNKPVVVQSEYIPSEVESLSVCRQLGLPVHDSISDAALSLRALSKYGSHIRNSHKKSDFFLTSQAGSSKIIEHCIRENRYRLTEYDANRFLQNNDIPTAPLELASTHEEAVAMATESNDPVAMKIASPDIEHKTEVGGVALDVGKNESGETYDQLVENVKKFDPEATVDGVLISPMIEDGVEVIIGVTHDKEVGPVLMFGLGGIFVETLNDVSFRALPITEYDATQLINNVNTSLILDGVRGQSGVDEQSLINLLLKVSDLIERYPRIKEIDLNPVLCHRDGLSVVDASIHLHSEGTV